jgi:hypothetical protein
MICFVYNAVSELWVRYYFDDTARWDEYPEANSMGMLLRYFIDSGVIKVSDMLCGNIILFEVAEDGSVDYFSGFVLDGKVLEEIEKG